jgi:hypothetical protein
MNMPGKSGDGKMVVNAAEAVGKAAGKVAALVGAGPQTQPGGEPASTPLAPGRSRGIPAGRLQKKDNRHLPRRLKKAQKKNAQKEIRTAA